MKSLPIIAILTVAAAAHSATLSPGNLAPGLDVKTWYKGTPVTSFDKNKTYVVEFWATWCGPCRESIPHLTELAKRNKDVTFVGVSIWEDEKGTNISDFVNKMGDKMDYHVGYSGNQTGMARTWMAAAGQNGIPTAFVVKDRKIEWIGHPMELETPLSQIKAGTFNEAGFRTDFARKQQAAEEEKAARQAMNECDKLFDSGKRAEAKAQLDAIVKQHPNMFGAADSIRFGWFAKEDPAAWEAKAKTMASAGQRQLMEVVSFAIGQLQRGDKVLAGKAIGIALEGSKHQDFLVLYDGAMIYDKLDQPKEALACSKEMLALLPKTQYKDNAELVKQLNDQEKTLEAKVK